MRKNPLVLTLLVLVGALACRTAPIYEVDRQPLRGVDSFQEAQNEIARAARMNGWEVELVNPGHFIATKRKGRHVASVDIHHDGWYYSIHYRNSAMFKYDGQNIHKLYNFWIESLENTINGEVAAP